MERTYVLQAGHAFGDGAHPSTALALWMLATLLEDFRPRNALDIGCGSGILSIAAALQWRIPVLACDIDAVAVAQTQMNARDNDLLDLVSSVRADGVRHDGIRAGAPYDLIMSNILTDLHIRHAREMARLLAEGGVMLLSGILTWRVPELLAYYEALGCYARAQENDGDWTALLLGHKNVA